MKKITLTICISLISIGYAFSQNSCCSSSSTQQFAALGIDQGFKEAHLYPKEYKFKGELDTISFKTKNGQNARGFMMRAEVPTNKYLFVFHEWWGLNDNIKREAGKYFKDLDSFNVFIIDLYDGKIATDRETAAKYMQSADENRIKDIISSAISYVGGEARISTIGWCFGGGWSLQAAIMAGDQANGCVMFYGMPEKNAENIDRLKTDVLGIFASKDEWINEFIVADFEKLMKDQKKELSLITYNAEHAFANPSNPKFDKESAKSAYRTSLNFIDKH